MRRDGAHVDRSAVTLVAVPTKFGMFGGERHHQVVTPHLGHHGCARHDAAILVRLNAGDHGKGRVQHGCEPVVLTVQKNNGLPHGHAELVQRHESAVTRESEAARNAELINLACRRLAHGTRTPRSHQRIELPATLGRQKLGVAQPLRKIIGHRDGAHPHGNRTSQGPASHLIHTDDEPRTASKELALECECGFGNHDYWRGATVGVVFVSEVSGSGAGTSANVSG